jgi:hypothetical protein
MLFDFLSDIIINKVTDIELVASVGKCDILYINIPLTKKQLTQICETLQPKHIIFRLQSNKLNKIQSEKVVFTIPVSSTTCDTFFPSSVNRMTFYWNKNRSLTKNIFPPWIYEMYNNIFHNNIIDSLDNLYIKKPIQKHRITKNKHNKTFIL